MTRIYRTIVLVFVFALSIPQLLAAVPAGSEAQYYLASSSENQSPPVKRVRIAAGPVEKVNGRNYQWWEMILEKPDGKALGLKMLSERVPMTGPGGVGDVARYIYSAGEGECLEYVDQQTGKALLPELGSFKEDFLPQVYEEARYLDGFANTGKLIGHVLVRSNIRPDFPKVDFSSPKVLRLASDLLIGSQTDERDDRDESVPVEDRKHSPLTIEEYREMMAAGANYFRPRPEAMEWLKNEPVFLGYTGIHPDDTYRSNFIQNRMFIDEPATRFGWSEGVPGDIVSPDIIAEALVMRVEESNRLQNRLFQHQNTYHSGTMEALYNKAPSWDTQQYTAYYQMAGGVPGLIFEGRYVKRGYGWNPEALLGEGLEGLTDKQQYDYFHAFLRGAARRWNAYWGTSVYPEGDKFMMVAALSKAYDQGARCLWMWNDRNLPYKWRVKVLKGLQEHIRNHPRGSYQKALRSAEAAIVLPKGYMLTHDGVWHMNPEVLNQYGVSYRDISAAATFEGILLSRAGIEYDYVNDYPGIKKAGYSQLIYIRENGKVEYVPKRTAQTVPVDLTLSASPKSGESTAGRMSQKPDYTIARPADVKIDGDLADWAGASWIMMEGEKYAYCDNWRTEVTIKIPDDVDPKMDNSYIGFTWEQNNEDYRTKYRLEGWSPNEVVVTSVKPGSPAAEAGLREGDVIHYMGSKWTRWPFEVWGIVDNHKRKPGSEITLKVQRGGLDNYGGRDDLSGRFAFMVDDSYLYFAADVLDDVHQQTMMEPILWQNDCVQIGFDPTLARTNGYGEQGHEIGLALKDGKPVVYRWTGRRGQPVGVMKAARAAIVRKGSRTVYEAAVSLSELSPLSPDMWKQSGICVTVNDSDDGKSRKQRIELVTKAMTGGKKLDKFPIFEFEPSGNKEKLNAAIIWNRRCANSRGHFEVTAAVSSPKIKKARAKVTLASSDTPSSGLVRAEVELPVTEHPQEFTLSAFTSSPPGRYVLTVELVSPDGKTAAKDSLPVYVY